MRAAPWRMTGRGGARLDQLLSVALITVLELESWLAHDIPRSHRLVTTVAIFAFTAPVAVRRRWPLGALVFACAVALLQTFLGGRLSVGDSVLLPPVVLAYGAGTWLGLRRSVDALALGLATFLPFVLLSKPRAASAGSVATDVIFVTLLLAAPWFVGRLARERARRAVAFGALAAQAAAERDERERAAIAQERSRIGGELQDIIAHNVSAMVVQAGGARRLLHTEPERARESILTVEQIGRETLADLRRLLGMLRKEDDPRALAPQPGLAELEKLVASTRATGLECELSEDGKRLDLTPGIDLVAYRVIETTLQTAVRGGGSQRARVTIRYRPERLELEISGDGQIDLDTKMAGVAERVALYDGDLQKLPDPISGFAVRARLPLGATTLA